jgi:uncharacterized protein
MSDFATAREVLGFGRKLSRGELIRALRFSIAAEYEAVQIYEQIIEAVDDPQIKAVVTDIIDEEKLHAGQFVDLLCGIDPEELKAYQKGAQENMEIREKEGR